MIISNFKVGRKYYSQLYKFQFGGIYGILIRHIENKYPVKFGYDHCQTQIL